MENPKSSLFIAQGNHDIKHQDSTVGTSEKSYQGSAPTGGPKNGSNAIPLLVEEQVSESTERPLGCNQGNQGSVSTTGVSGKDGNVKPNKEAPIKSLCKRKCSWGLIWRSKKLGSYTCEDFISRKIILKGNPDMLSLKPTCYYCSQPYDSDLMYIQCETCPSWYHADAVGLEEKRISDLVGFKCCRCRKIRKPACPYLAPEVKKLQVESSKVKNMVVDSCPGSVQEQQDLLPKSAEEMPHVAHGRPLPVSSLQVQPQPENSQQMYHEQDTAIDSGVQKLQPRPENSQQMYHEQDTAIDSGVQKLPVRRSVKQKKCEARKK